MIQANPISRAIDLAGLQRLASACAVTYQAVRKWERVGLPRTEWTDETDHSSKIAAATGGVVSKQELLAYRPRRRRAAPRKRAA